MHLVHPQTSATRVPFPIRLRSATQKTCSIYESGQLGLYSNNSWELGSSATSCDFLRLPAMPGEFRAVASLAGHFTDFSPTFQCWHLDMLFLSIANVIPGKTAILVGNKEDVH